MICSVTKAMLIQFIAGKCHIKKQKGRKAALSSYYAWLSCDLLLMPSEAGHMCTHTNIHGQNNIKKPGLCGPGLKVF